MSERPVIVITGGGRGIGAATAKLAAARGHAVCVNYLHGREPAEDVVRYITARNGEAIAIQADISSEADVVSMFRQVDSRWPSLRSGEQRGYA